MSERHSFSQQGYLLVRDFLPADILDFLKVYYRVLRANGRFVADWYCPGSLSLGGDGALDAVVEWARPRVSQLVEQELASTYSYTRVYAKGDTLLPHRDRPSCEVSVTVPIEIPSGAPPSLLMLRPHHSDAVRINLSEGDACIYAGPSVEHWREPFENSGQVQLFLHYISVAGEHFPDLVFDGRRFLGAEGQEG